MKILQILPELNIGGVERGTVDLARTLVKYNHQPYVISNGGNLVEELELSGVKHIRLPVHKKSLLSIIRCVGRVAKVLEDEGIDIVHARSRVPAIIAFLACRRTNTRFVTTCHGYYSQNFFSRVMGWGKLVIVSSHAIARHMIEDFGVPEERIRLIPRGVDLEEFKFRQTRQAPSYKPSVFTVGVIGRLTPIKGHKYFLEALAKVIRVFPRMRAQIVGDASSARQAYREELKMLSRRLSLDKYVEFTGRQKDIAKVLSTLDALILSTVTEEAFGRVLIEAGACGVPVIATRVGGVVDIIEDEVNGLLVSPRDAADLASAILRLVQDQELSQRLVLEARRKVEQKFSLEQMAEKTIQAYEQAKASLRILIIKLSALGDVILAGPSLRAIRERFPGAHIAVLTSRTARPVLESCPYINQIIEFPAEGEKKDYKKIWQTSVLLRRFNFDMVIDLQNSRLSHILAYLSGCARRFGYNNRKFGFLLNKKVKPQQDISPVKHQGRTLKLLGVEQVKEDLELWLKPEEETWAENFLKENKKEASASLIGINLGASPKWPSKKWETARFAQLFEKIKNAGMEIMVTGKGADNEYLESLSRLYPHHFINVVNQTSIGQLAGLIKRCKVYVTSDSAPLHIAYAVKTPVVALFGPTDPGRHTLEEARQIVIKKEAVCKPCYKRRCRQNVCMQEISVEEVFEAVQRLMSKG